MESVPLNSPIPIPLQTVKRGVYSIHKCWISNSCGSSGCLLPQGAGREVQPQEWFFATPSFTHAANTARLARDQGPERGVGLQYRRRHACPHWTCLLLLNFPTGASVQLPLRTPAPPTRQLPPGCWYCTGITRVPPLNPQYFPLPSSGLQLSFLMERNSMHEFFNYKSKMHPWKKTLKTWNKGTKWLEMLLCNFDIWENFLPVILHGYVTPHM